MQTFWRFVKANEKHQNTFHVYAKLNVCLFNYKKPIACFSLMPYPVYILYELEVNKYLSGSTKVVRTTNSIKLDRFMYKWVIQCFLLYKMVQLSRTV
jgi:hypothetical protein